MLQEKLFKDLTKKKLKMNVFLSHAILGMTFLKVNLIKYNEPYSNIGKFEIV